MSITLEKLQKAMFEKIEQDIKKTDEKMDWFGFEVKMRVLFLEIIDPLSRKQTETREDYMNLQKEFHKME